MKALPLLLTALLPLIPLDWGFLPTAQAQPVFQFAGFEFDQRNTPDIARMLGEGVTLGGAIFSAGLPTSSTGVIPNFPTPTTGFDGSLGLANLVGLVSGLGPRAINLPNGNSGVATRHGVAVRWSGNRGLANLPGQDFVVYEAGSSIASVESIVARVHSVGQVVGTVEHWTDWYYFPPANFQLDLGGEGEFSDVFDLSNMGLIENEVIDEIQICNLTASDRIEGSGTEIRPGVFVGTGKVVFDGSSQTLPDAGHFDSDRLFDSTTLDPDPLYLAALHITTSIGPRFTSIHQEGDTIQLSISAGEGNWVVESAEAISDSDWKEVDHFSLSASGSSEVKDIGQNGRPKPLVGPQRYYRVRSQ